MRTQVLHSKIVTACFLLLLTACSQQQFGLMSQESLFGQSVNYVNKVDILWVVDNSTSMSQHQAMIAQNVGAFVNTLRNTGMDFHIGVTTMDAGGGGEKGRLLTTPAGSPAVLTNSTANLTSILQTRLQMGDGGSTIERAFESMKLAITDPNLSGSNAGFRRDEAVLAVIFLTNEDDESGSAVPDPAAFLDSRTIESQVTGEKMWVVNFIGTTPTDPDCMTVPWTREDGLAFIELAEESGGAVESICNGDFSTAMTNVQGHILSIMTEWRFPRRPQLATIKVYINGVLVPQSATNGWTYHADRQTLKFHGTGVPPVGSTIKVDYLPEGFSG